jgi:hypothetical protein
MKAVNNININTSNKKDKNTKSKFKWIIDFSNFLVHYFVPIFVIIFLFLIVGLILITTHPTLANIFLLLFSMLIIIHIILTIFSMLRSIFINLLKKESELTFKKLIINYIVAVVLFLMLFTVFYSVSSISKDNYLQWGQCQGQSSLVPNQSNTLKVAPNDIIGKIYFSGVTFFTVGYGDICPQGNITRIIALFNAWTGHFFTAIVLATSIGYIYLNTNRPKNRKHHK